MKFPDPKALKDSSTQALENGSFARCPSFRRLAILALSLALPLPLMAGQPPIILRSPPLKASQATLERLAKLRAFRSGPILFRVGCKVVQGRIVKVSIEQSSRHPFLDQEGTDWVTRHWGFGPAATGTYHVPLVVGAGTRTLAGKTIPGVPHPAHMVPKLPDVTWNDLLQTRHGVAFNVHLIVRIEVRDGSILTARVTRTSGIAMADSAVLDWIKSRWKFPKTVQSRHIFELNINVDPSPKRRSITVTSKGTRKME